MDNQILAKIIFKNGLASQDQIKAVWGEVSESENIAQVLIRNQILDGSLYEKILGVAQKRMAKNAAAAPAPENKPQAPKAPTGPQGPKPMAPRGPAPRNPASSVEAVEAPKPQPPQVKKVQQVPTPPTEEDGFVHEEPEIQPYVKAEKPTAPVESLGEVTGNSPETTENEPAKSEFELRKAERANVEVTIGLDTIAPLEFGKVPLQIETVGVLEATELSDMGRVAEIEAQEKSSNPEPVQTTNSAPANPANPGKKPDPIAAEVEEVGAALPIDFEGDRGDGNAIRVPEKLTGGESLNELLAYARLCEATDIHIAPYNPVLLKLNGALDPRSERLNPEQIEKMVAKSLSRRLFEKFEQTGDLETVQAVPGFGRFRVTLMKQQKGWDVTARVIPSEVPDFAKSGLPENCLGLTKWAQGLVLITGPAGAGKTRTLSVLVNEVNKDRKDHIISIENPIEVVYPEGGCQITQREVGLSTQSQANALRAALRQDPDIIVVSELRDLESMELAISAAETGHLVFATMNTTNAMRTLSRLIDSFPPEEQDIIRAMVSESLRGVISQQLIPNKEGDGLETAFELLLLTLPIANLIRKNEMHQLESAMITGRSQGMITLDDSLKALVDAGKIEGKEAYYRAVNPKNFERYL